MNEAEYINDMNHNYLVLKHGEATVLLEEKMLLNNQIQGLLTCFVRMFNGEKRYYYDISSKQSVQKLFERKELDYENIKNIVLSLQEQIRILDEYLMDGKYLLLNPEYIYMDIETEQIFFCILPIKDKEQDIKMLAEYFLQKADHNDQKAVLLVYELYKGVCQSHFQIDQLDAYLHQEQSLPVKEEIQEKKVDDINEDKYIEPDLSLNKSKKSFFPILVKIVLLLSELAVCGYFILICTSPAGKGIGFFDVDNAGVIGAILAIILAAQILYIAKAIKKNFKKSENQDQTTEQKMYFEEEYVKATVGNIENQVASHTYGETVLLDNIEQGHMSVPVLTGKVDGIPVEFFIDKDYYLLGKKKGSVDGVLSDSSVSRVHAAIYCKDGEYFLEDLNSKNGTHKNGCRFNANETQLLQHGDMIQFGIVKLKFYC